VPVVSFEQSIAANAESDISLAPFDRFGGQGGRVAVRSTVIAASSGDVNLTLMVGSDVVQQASPIFGEAALGIGPDRNTPAVAGIGAPGDPITVRLANTTGAAIVVRGVVDIQNA